MNLLGRGSFKNGIDTGTGRFLGKITVKAFLDERCDCYRRNAIFCFPELRAESEWDPLMSAWEDVVKQYMTESTTFASMMALVFTCLHNEKRSPEQAREWALRRLAISALLEDLDDETTDNAFFIAHDISSISFAVPYRTGRRGQMQERYRELLGYMNIENSETSTSEAEATKHQQDEAGERGVT